MNDEELGVVSESIYAEGFGVDDAAEVCNLNNVVSFLSHVDAVQRYGRGHRSNSIQFRGAYLEIDVKLPDNLCSGRTVDGHGFDGQTRTTEGGLCRW